MSQFRPYFTFRNFFIGFIFGSIMAFLIYLSGAFTVWWIYPLIVIFLIVAAPFIAARHDEIEKWYHDNGLG